MGLRENDNAHYADADYWYRQAAEQGDAQAQFDLGFDYAVGRGVVQNSVKANQWYPTLCRVD